MGLKERLGGPEGELMFSTAGIYFFYLYYGVLQERIFRPDPTTGERFTMTLFLLAAQCFCNFALGALALAFNGGKGTERKEAGQVAETSPLSGLMSHTGTTWTGIISLSYLAAMGCSNQSLQYVSYPFQAISKSCKMVPVMLANVLIGGKRYSLLEYSTTLMITAGVVLFQLGDNKKSFLEGNTGWGIALLLFSLACDGVTSSNQRLFSDEYKPSGHFLMMYMNMWALVFLAPLLALTGEGSSGLAYVLSHPQTLTDLLMFGLCSAVGQLFIFFCIVGPGPLACTTITTTRKFFTVLLSVLWYPENSLSPKQWVAVLMVFAGVAIELIHKRLKQPKGKKE